MMHAAATAHPQDAARLLVADGLPDTRAERATFFAALPAAEAEVCRLLWVDEFTVSELQDALGTDSAGLEARYTAAVAAVVAALGITA
jgi:DNA-directed RNA polymerase specialized sigma24 family protein